MKRVFFLALAVISFNLASAQQKPLTSNPLDSAGLAKLQTRPVYLDSAKQQPAYFLVGAEADFKVLEGLVANFKGLSFVEVKPILDWIASRKQLTTAAEPKK